MDIANLSVKMKGFFELLVQQISISTEKRYLYKNPVATLTDLKALTEPEDGEVRQVLSHTDKAVKYTFMGANTTGVAADDSTVGSWITTDLDVQGGGPWESAVDYPAGVLFSFETSVADAVDVHGTPLESDRLYLAQYVDANGDAIATLSGATLDLAELAKMEVLSADEYTEEDSTLLQSYTDGIFLPD